ncbi:hypothetical protein ACFONC_01330 [Luteimonas soli]|uniref:Uncharacterized protein n=1 Tax=Luteimonas soli TaxID=1648966 RepID=A0ABV7XF95_9GAMM
MIQQLVDRGGCEQATVLIVGAGSGVDLPLLRRLGPRRLVLAEAHPEQAEALSGRVDPARGEEVWPLAISAEPLEQASLHVVNNLAFSSLKAPTGLLEYFPNLREVRQDAVPTRSLAAAIETLALDAGAEHLLVLDAPGQAFELLGATPPQALRAFATVIVRCSLEPLYEGDEAVEEVLATLRKIGFDPGNRDSEAIYPQTAIVFARSESHAEKLQLEALLAQVKADCDAQMQLASRHTKEIEHLIVDRDRAAALAQEHKADLDQASRLAAERGAELEKATQLAAERQKLVASRDEQVQKLVEERDAQAKLAAERGAELEKATQLAAERQKLVASRDEQVQKLVEERDAQAKLAAERGAEVEKAAQLAAERQKLVASRDEQVQKLVEERDAQAKLAAERGAELEKATQLAAERQKLVASRDEQVQKLVEERDAQAKLAAEQVQKLMQERDGQAKLVAERQVLLDKASSQNQERGARIIELEREQARLDRHQAWLDQEVIKAEAQVELIKDILLRDKAT